MRKTKKNKKTEFQLSENIEDTLPDEVIEFFDLLKSKIQKRDSFLETTQFINSFLRYYSFEIDRNLSDPEWLYLATMALLLLKNSNIEITQLLRNTVLEEAAKRNLRKKDIKFHLKDLVEKDIIESHYPANKRNKSDVNN